MKTHDQYTVQYISSKYIIQKRSIYSAQNVILLTKVAFIMFFRYEKVMV